MNDVQLALLIAGLVIILVLIIYNWSELKTLSKKQASLTKPKNSISEENDPLFHNFNNIEETVEVVEPFEPSEKKINEPLTGSEKIINSNLPDGIDRDIETVISITCQRIQESSSGLLLEKIKSMPGVRVYIRKDNDLWATESAIYDTIRYNQILLVLLLASRKYILDSQGIDDFKQLANDISSNVDGPIFLSLIHI